MSKNMFFSFISRVAQSLLVGFFVGIVTVLAFSPFSSPFDIKIRADARLFFSIVLALVSAIVVYRRLEMGRTLKSELSSLFDSLKDSQW